MVSYCWDASPLISLFQDEKRERQEEMIGLRTAEDAINSGEVILVTSTIVFCELLQTKMTHEQFRVFEQFCRRDNVEVVQVSHHIARRAGRLCSACLEAGVASLATPDALYVATALVADCDELHSFDSDHLELATDAAGIDLVIKPPAGPHAPRLPGTQ